jgi:hypothetical protein
MLILALTITNFIEEVEADRQLCAPNISMLIPALAITKFIEEVEVDRQLCAPKISMLIPALAMIGFTHLDIVLLVTALNVFKHYILFIVSDNRKLYIVFMYISKF